jgi:hypothetical protein
VSIRRGLCGLCGLTALFSFLAITGCSREPSPRQVQEWSAEIERLQAERDSLQQRAAVLVKNDSLIQALPKGDVVIRIPTRFVRSIIRRVFDQVANNVTLRLGGFHAHVAKSVRKFVKVGDFVVDAQVHDVFAKLRPRQPEITFAGNRVAMSLPVEVPEGRGNATVRFVWDGKNVADLTCGDMDVSKTVSGEVVPSRYLVAGTLHLAIQGNRVIGTPRFPETRLRIRVRPSKQSWSVIDSLLAEKRGVCGWVLDKVDVPALLQRIVEERGFNVKLPLHKIRPFAIRSGISDSVTVQGRILSVATTTNTIRIDPEAILYSADVVLK